jgi:hypothetical protein
MVTNEKNWVVDSDATVHICAIKEFFFTYTSFKDKEEIVYIGDSRTANIFRTGKVLLKLTSEKMLALNKVLHVLNIRVNFIYVALFRKLGSKYHLNMIRL